MRTLQSELKRNGLIPKEKKKVEVKSKEIKRSESYEYQKSIEDEERRQRELADLMGTGRDTYKRVKGSVRRR